NHWAAFQPLLVNRLYQMVVHSLIGRDRYTAGVAEAVIEVRQRDDNRLVTLLEVISPAKKITLAGTTAYTERVRAMQANTVDIDLLLQGRPLFDYANWDYAVMVTRSTHPERFEIYSSTLSKRLPSFRLPLGIDDRDAVLDLQLAVTQAYDLGDFRNKIDYTN